MSAITDLELKLNAIRTTDEYQKMYTLIEEMENTGELNREKMIRICRYVNPDLYVDPDLWPEDYYEKLDDDELEKNYMICAESVRYPYVCVVDVGELISYGFRSDMLEMVYSKTLNHWRIVTNNYEREKYERSTYSVSAINETHESYCIFKRDCNLDEVAKILRIEYTASHNSGFNSHWLKKFCAFAEKKDPEFDLEIMQPGNGVTAEEEMKTVKQAEKILGISITEW